MRLSQQQGLLYCCCLRPLLFPRWLARGGTTVPMMGKRPPSKPFLGVVEVHSGRCEWPPHDNGSCASARVIERVLRINRNAAGFDRDTWVGVSYF